VTNSQAHGPTLLYEPKSNSSFGLPPSPVIILAIDKLRLFRMKFQPTVLKRPAIAARTSWAAPSFLQCHLCSRPWRLNTAAKGGLEPALASRFRPAAGASPGYASRTG
jgi:hypothetical protein